MSDMPDPVVTEEVTETPEAPRAPAQPIRSRFLFVDVAAQRAKQLRRGAQPRVEMPDAHKLERVAMREVSNGCIDWSLPNFRGATPESNA
jgi:DNA-directed RNA polymerase omega subunit